MSIVKVKKHDILHAIDKASICVKDTYIISISNKETCEGRKFASICSSDGNTQVLACFTAESNNPTSFIVGSELQGALKALSEFGDEYEIEVTDSVAKISAGSATLPIQLKKEGFSIIQPQGNPDDGYVAVLSRESFVKAAKQGSFAYGGQGSAISVINTVALLPYTEGDESKLCFFSSDGRLAASSYSKTISVNERFKKAEKKYININAPALRAICSKIEGENITISILEKQVIIKDGNDYYTIIRYENEFPAKIAELLDFAEYNYKAVLDVSMLKAALRVATLTDNNKRAAIIISNEKVIITAIAGENKAQVKAVDVEGEIDIHINSKHMEMVISEICSSELTIYGMSDLQPIYMTDGIFKGLMTPIRKTS